MPENGSRMSVFKFQVSLEEGGVSQAGLLPVDRYYMSSERVEQRRFANSHARYTNVDQQSCADIALLLRYLRHRTVP
jgi:hypothetical protein